MKNNLNGSIFLARQLLESEIFFWKSDKWFKIWIFLLLSVNFTDTKLFKRGEGLFTYQETAIKCKATTNQVKHCFEYLRKANMIATHRTTRGLIVNIIKYPDFQDLKANQKATEKLKAQAEKRMEQASSVVMKAVLGETKP